MKTFGITLKEIPLDEGLDIQETTELFNMLHGTKGIPYEVQGKFSSAVGFINLTDAEILNYRYGEDSAVYQYIKSILDDMELENETGNYTFFAEGGDFSNEIVIHIER